MIKINFQKPKASGHLIAFFVLFFFATIKSCCYWCSSMKKVLVKRKTAFFFFKITTMSKKYSWENSISWPYLVDVEPQLCWFELYLWSTITRNWSLLSITVWFYLNPGYSQSRTKAFKATRKILLSFAPKPLATVVWISFYGCLILKKYICHWWPRPLNWGNFRKFVELRILPTEMTCLLPFLLFVRSIY